VKKVVTYVDDVVIRYGAANPNTYEISEYGDKKIVSNNSMLTEGPSFSIFCDISL
jgi:hypothetical protein